jgi:abortive infection bacteriophage resistance protein
MKFDKPPLTIEQQADLLLSRGLIAEKDILIHTLTAVNYYRLSAYLYPFQNIDQSFKEDTSLERIWNRYTFDRQLRLLIMDAIERIEVSVRTKLAYHLSHECGPFAQEDPHNFPDLGPEQYLKWYGELKEEVYRSTEPFILRFIKTYGDMHTTPPVWMMVEVMSFGKTLTMFRGVHYTLRQTIAAYYSVSDKIFFSWLLALNSTRNICAHHGKLIDRELGYQPKIPRLQKYPEWHLPIEIARDRVFGILTILRYLMRIDAPANSWKYSLNSFIENHEELSIVCLGFPSNWKESVLWRIEL